MNTPSYLPNHLLESESRNKPSKAVFPLKHTTMFGPAEMNDTLSTYQQNNMKKISLDYIEYFLQRALIMVGITIFGFFLIQPNPDLVIFKIVQKKISKNLASDQLFTYTVP